MQSISICEHFDMEMPTNKRQYHITVCDIELYLCDACFREMNRSIRMVAVQDSLAAKKEAAPEELQVGE